ncbi:unnamed protein product [Schistosoma margrebowiei]|uniref:Peptidase C1A papain C-terminal domain-containing protein n=1 Tax=Schistosoma margrebowiei TaxID=48269 RepID=A0AA84ZSK8_9TREM|nr:unnamed protein product [Schistosoma margrebowiei]
MKVFLLLNIILTVTIAQQLNSQYDEIWKLWKFKYNKTYSINDEIKRKLIFMNYVTKIHQHNLRYDLGLESYTMGLNQFCDMNWNELKTILFPHRFINNHPLLWNDNNEELTLLSHISYIPLKWDWRDYGLVTPVKDQGMCGSCWAFSTTGSIEGQFAKIYKKSISLSEQQLIDCSYLYGNHGCHGGTMDQSFNYLKKYPIESEFDYPYKGVKSSCHFHLSKGIIKIKKFIDLPTKNEKILQKAVYHYGPISVAIDASFDFVLYKSGIYESKYCSSSLLNHAVLVIGYGTEHNKDYWLIKNSWSDKWGMNGYIKLRRNKHNMCGIATNASFPIL